MKQNDIFEDMRKQAGCDYISDLPQLSFSLLRQTVEKLSGADYSVQQWEELTEYLVGSMDQLEDPEREKMRLLQRLG